MAYSALALVRFSAAVIACAAVISFASPRDRLAKLNSVRATKRDGLLILNQQSFRKYVEPSSRPYSLFVLITADPSICPACGKMKADFAAVSGSYYSLPSNLQARHHVFFAELRISTSFRELLSDYGISHVPMLHHFPPGSSKSFPAPLAAAPGASYDMERLGVSKNSFKLFVNAQAGARFPVQRAGYEIPFASRVRSLMPAIATCAGLFAAAAAYSGWMGQPMFWFGVCVLVYMYSLGGGHYTWINDSPFAVVDSQGTTQYVAEGSRNQYVAEGMFVSLACTVISAVLIATNELPRLIPSKGGQTVVGLTMSFLVSIFILMLLGLYFVKMPSYLKYEA